VNRLTVILAFASALGCGLVAGLFFAFSNFVMKSLARLPSDQGIAAMQNINVDVLNRWFFVVFFGTGCVASLSSCRRSFGGTNRTRSISSSAVCSISLARSW
jgi:uncharacterized membrane protein